MKNITSSAAGSSRHLFYTSSSRHFTLVSKVIYWQSRNQKSHASLIIQHKLLTWGIAFAAAAKVYVNNAGKSMNDWNPLLLFVILGSLGSALTYMRSYDKVSWIKSKYLTHSMQPQHSQGKAVIGQRPVFKITAWPCVIFTVSMQ